MRSLLCITAEEDGLIQSFWQETPRDSRSTCRSLELAVSCIQGQFLPKCLQHVEEMKFLQQQLLCKHRSSCILITLAVLDVQRKGLLYIGIQNYRQQVELITKEALMEKYNYPGMVGDHRLARRQQFWSIT